MRSLRHVAGVVIFEALVWGAIVAIALILFGAGTAHGADKIPVYSETNGPGLVDVETCTSGKVSKWNGSAWICVTDEGGVGSTGLPLDTPIVTYSADANATAERVITSGTNTTVDTSVAAQVKINVPDAAAATKGAIQLADDLGGTAASPDVVDVTCTGSCISDAEVDDLAVAGDVDGTLSAQDIDEAAVEAELESVIDLQDLQGAVTDAQVPNTITVDLATLATTASTANAGDSATAFFSSGTIEAARLPALAGDVDGAVDSNDLDEAAVEAEIESVVDLADLQGNLPVTKLNSGTAASSTTFWRGDGTWATPAGGGGVPYTELLTDVTCAASASYCTIWTVPAASITASGGVRLSARIIVDTDSTTVAPQFRVSSADTGYTGICTWILYDKAAATTTAPAYANIAIAAAPADTAQTAWGTTAPQVVEVECGLKADATPGDIIIEWQLETGTSPTQTVLAGSYYVLSSD